MYVNEMLITEKIIAIANEDIDAIISLLINPAFDDSIKLDIKDGYIPKSDRDRIIKALDEAHEHKPCPDIQGEVDLRNEIVEGLQGKINDLENGREAIKRMVVDMQQTIEELESFKTHAETAIREMFTPDGEWDPSTFSQNKLYSLWEESFEKGEKT